MDKETMGTQERKPRLEKLEGDMQAMLTMITNLETGLNEVREVVNGLCTEVESIRSNGGTDKGATVKMLLEAISKDLTAKKHAPKFGGRVGAKKVTDTKTNITYDSLSKCAKAIATEFNLDPNDHFAWYQILKLAPEGRFKILG